MVEQKQGFEDQHEVLMARVVATSAGGAVPVRIANLSSSAVTLYQGQKITKFCSLVKAGELLVKAGYEERADPDHPTPVTTVTLSLFSLGTTQHSKKRLLG